MAIDVAQVSTSRMWTERLVVICLSCHVSLFSCMPIFAFVSPSSLNTTGFKREEGDCGEIRIGHEWQCHRGVAGKSWGIGTTTLY